MRILKSIILALAILVVITTGLINYAISREPCGGITCGTIGCGGGERHCHDIICPEGPILVCYMPR